MSEPIEITAEQKAWIEENVVLICVEEVPYKVAVSGDDIEAIEPDRKMEPQPAGEESLYCKICMQHFTEDTTEMSIVLQHIQDCTGKTEDDA